MTTSLLTPKIVAGKRKTAIARIRLRPGKGRIIVNGRDALEYFKRPRLLHLVKKPITLTTSADNPSPYDIVARIKGGGLSGQADAFKHAIARAICILHPQKKKVLKDFKLTTRDARKVQRKLFGHKKARKSFQFSKR